MKFLRLIGALLSISVLLGLFACKKTAETSVPEKLIEEPAAIPTEVPAAEKEKIFHRARVLELAEGLNEQEHAFAVAVLTGDVQQVAALLAQGANPNQKVKNCKYINSPAICSATADASESVVKLLLDAGANPNTKCSSDETTPLMNASKRNVTLVHMLLKAGADVNAKDTDGRTALFQAQDSAVIKALLAAGADINATDNQGHNAFFDEYSKSGRAMKALLDAGIKVSQEDKDEALRKSCLNVGINGVEILLAAGANVNSHDTNGDTPLINAALAPLAHYTVENAETIIKMLIAAGADVNATDNDGNTALIRVMSEWSDSDGANEDRIEMIDILVAAGADVNATNKKGETALMSIHLEDFTDYDSIVKKLISVGADIDATDNQGRTVLMDFVNKVSEKEAALPAHDDYESESLSMEQIKSFLKTLLSSGVNINAKDKDGETALTLAQKAGNKEIVQLLKAAGAKE